MKFFKKYKYVILISFFIFLSYIIISSVNNIFGIDEIQANTYIYNPNLTLEESIRHIIYRVTDWNMRLGELIYFILGRFPKFVCTISNGITILLFFNLIFVFTYGAKSKEYFNTSKYYKSLLISFIVSLTIFPAFSEVMVWNAGIYNHIFSVNLSLIAALPFRLLLENYNLFDNHKKLKYLSFLAGFSVENVTAWMLIFNIVILFKIINKNNIKQSIKDNFMYIINIILTIIGFSIMYIFSKIRVDFFSQLDFVNASKKSLFIKIPYLYIYVIVIILILLFINIVKKKICIKKLKKIEKILLFQSFSSIISLIVIFITHAYFAYRVTTLFYIFQLILIIYLVNNLLENKIIKYTYILDIGIIIFMTLRLVFFYNDFNEFNLIRDKYIKDQYSNGTVVLSCVNYDNKYNYFFVERLTSFDALFCDNAYYSYILEDDSIELIRSYKKIRD